MALIALSLPEEVAPMQLRAAVFKNKNKELKSNGPSTGAIIGLVIGGLILLCCCLCCFMCFKDCIMPKGEEEEGYEEEEAHEEEYD